jgi:hypothetical protein
MDTTLLAESWAATQRLLLRPDLLPSLGLLALLVLIPLALGTLGSSATDLDPAPADPLTSGVPAAVGPLPSRGAQPLPTAMPTWAVGAAAVALAQVDLAHVAPAESDALDASWSPAPDEDPAEELATLRRLAFARWLVEQGRLSG